MNNNPQKNGNAPESDQMRELRARLQEAEDTLEAIRHGQVDSLLVSTPEGEQIFSLKSADYGYRVFVEQMSEGAVTVTMDGTIVYSNRQFAALLGLPLEEVLGHPFHEFVVPEERGLFDALLRDEDRRKARFEFALVRSEGAPVPGCLSFNRIEFNGLDCLSIVATDLTEQKRSEEIERSNKELEHFAYVASHDLQEPLRKIISFSDRLKAHEGPFGEPQKDYLERLQNAARRMKQLVEDLLNFSRVTARPDAFEQVPLKKVVAEVLSVLDTRVTEASAVVQVGSLPIVRANGFQMHQLFQNLIANALKFRKRDEPSRITVRTHKIEDGFAEIEVADNGIGFDEKYLDKIFKPFQRLHGRDEYEGTGMGLAICQKIAHYHGGSLTAMSRPGKGSAFLVRLPVASSAPSGQNAPALSEAPSR